MIRSQLTKKKGAQASNMGLRPNLLAKYAAGKGVIMPPMPVREMTHAHSFEVTSDSRESFSFGYVGEGHVANAPTDKVVKAAVTEKYF